MVGAAVRHSDECRGLHRHIEGGCDDAQRPAAGHSLDNASFRPGHCARFCIRLHRRYMRCGLPAGVRLLLLPSHLDASGTDHQGVVLDPPTLQPRAPGQPASRARPSLVPLLALPTHPITSPWRWDKLPGHRIARTYPVTAETGHVTCFIGDG